MPVTGTSPPSTLVLGGSGFLGLHVSEAAARSGGRVLCASRSRPPRGSANEAEHVALDASDAGGVAALLDALRPDRVIDCCALSRGEACERDPELATRLNTRLPEALGRWAARSGVRLVHVSTDLVFGGAPPRPEGYGEDDPPDPLSVYGRSKAEGESALLAACPEALVVRLPLLFGDSRGRAAGASDSLLAAIARGVRPSLFVDEIRAALSVEEAAAALVELAELESTDPPARGVLHVAGPEAISRLELGRLVLLAAGHREHELVDLVRPVRQRDLDLRPPRPPDVTLDARRARALLHSPLSAPRELLRPTSSDGVAGAP